MVGGFVGQGSGFRNNTNFALFEYKAGHNTHFGLVGGNHAGAVGANQANSALFNVGLGLHHVRNRNALGDAHDDLDSGVRSFHDSVGGKCGRNKNDRNVCTRSRNCIAHGIEYGAVEVGLATFAWRNSAHHVRAVGDHLLGMEASLFTSETLDDNFG